MSLYTFHHSHQQIYCGDKPFSRLEAVAELNRLTEENQAKRLAASPDVRKLVLQHLDCDCTDCDGPDVEPERHSYTCPRRTVDVDALVAAIEIAMKAKPLIWPVFASRVHQRNHIENFAVVATSGEEAVEKLQQHLDPAEWKDIYYKSMPIQRKPVEIVSLGPRTTAREGETGWSNKS